MQQYLIGAFHELGLQDIKERYTVSVLREPTVREGDRQENENTKCTLGKGLGPAGPQEGTKPDLVRRS